MTFEELLKMKVEVDRGDGVIVSVSPEFRVSVQEIAENQVHAIIHADGYDSETIDFYVMGNVATT